MRASLSISNQLANTLKFSALLLLPLFFVGCGTTAIENGGVYRSTDSAESWNQKVFVRNSSEGQVLIDNLSIKRFVQHPKNPEALYALTTGGVYVTEDDAESWTKLPINANAVDLDFNKIEPKVIYLSTGDEILKSLNEGETWEVMYKDSENRQVAQVLVDPINPNRILAFLTTTSVLISRDGGVEWSAFSEIPTKSFVREAIRDPKNPDVIYALTENEHVLRSLDGGATWEDLWDNVKDQVDGVSKTQNLQVTNDGTLWLGSNRTLLTSQDQGATWSVVPSILAAKSTVNVYVVDPENSSFIVIVDDLTIHKSENGGTTWKTIETYPSSRIVTDIVVKRESAGEILFTSTKPRPEEKNPYFPFL